MWGFEWVLARRLDFRSTGAWCWVVAPLLFFPIVWRSNPAYSLPLILIPLAAFTLALLPRIKGGWIGMMYALGVKDTDARLQTADAAD